MSACFALLQVLPGELQRLSKVKKGTDSLYLLRSKQPSVVYGKLRHEHDIPAQ